MAATRGLVGLVFTALTFGAASAQQIRGRVVDAGSERPLARVPILAVGTGDAVLATGISDANGDFVLQLRKAEAARIRVTWFGYHAAETPPRPVGPADTVRVDIRLQPNPIRLPEVVAATGARNLQAFLRRREVRKWGQFLGPAELAELQPRSGDELLSSMVGLRRTDSGPGIVGTRYSRMRPTSSPCRPWVFIDNQRMEWWRTNPGDHLDTLEVTSTDFYVPVESIRGVEVYRAPYDAPAQYHIGTNRNCAIILIWTDLGFGLRPK